ncbi:MAG: cache domain-containing protein, partial [bacterium]
MKNNNFEKFEVKNSKFFIKNLVIFLIPVILPVLVLGLFSIYITQEYLQENINIHNQNLLVQAKNQVENVFEETESIYKSLISNPEINSNLKRILESRNLSPDDYKLIRFLNNSISSQARSRDYIHSIYIYFENSQGTFLSSNEGLSYSNNFFDTSWKKEYENRKEIKNRWMTYRKIYPEGHNNSAEEVFSLYWVNKNNDLAEGTVVLNIYSEYLKDILASFDTLEQQKLIVVDSQDDLLFSNERLSYLDKMNTLYKLRVNDEQTIINQENSDLFNWKYYSIVPEDIIYAAPIEITKILIFLLIFLVFLGLFVSYYLTKKNYNRITNIIEIINHA